MTVGPRVRNPERRGVGLVFRTGLRLGRQALWRSILIGAALAPLGALLGAVDGGSAARVAEFLRLAGPLVFAAGLASVIAGSKRDGAWDAWMALGLSPRAILVPVLILSLILGVAYSLAGGVRFEVGQEGALLQLPSPVPLKARIWPALVPGGTDPLWTEERLAAWKRPPSQLRWGELLERLAQKHPRGARGGVDAAEALRRLGWSAAWLVAGLAGFRRGSARSKRQGATEASAAFEAIAWVLVWLGGVVLVSSALAGLA